MLKLLQQECLQLKSPAINALSTNAARIIINRWCMWVFKTRNGSKVIKGDFVEEIFDLVRYILQFS